MPNLNDLFSGGFGFSSIVPFVFIVIALIFLVAALRQRAKVGSAKRNWETTSGRVLFSQVETRRTRSGGGTSTSYVPRVVYEYAVNGNKYQGNRVALGSEVGRGSYRSVEEKMTASYPSGQIVQVHYNPANPQDAALELRAPSSNLFIFVVLVIIVITSVTVLLTAGGFGVAQQLIDQITNLIPQGAP